MAIICYLLTLLCIHLSINTNKPQITNKFDYVICMSKIGSNVSYSVDPNGIPERTVGYDGQICAFYSCIKDTDGTIRDCTTILNYKYP